MVGENHSISRAAPALALPNLNASRSLRKSSGALATRTIPTPEESA